MDVCPVGNVAHGNLPKLAHLHMLQTSCLSPYLCTALAHDIFQHAQLHPIFDKLTTLEIAKSVQFLSVVCVKFEVSAYEYVRSREVINGV